MEKSGSGDWHINFALILNSTFPAIIGGKIFVPVPGILS